MDMKRLKKNMWDLLTDTQKNQTVAEVSAGGDRYLKRPKNKRLPCR